VEGENGAIHLVTTTALTLEETETLRTLLTLSLSQFHTRHGHVFRTGGTGKEGKGLRRADICRKRERNAQDRNEVRD